MKKLLPLLLCILLLTGCAETYDGPTETRSVLAEYTSIHYYTYYSGNQDQIISTTTYSYDIYGNQARSLFYRGGKLELEARYRHDEHGNIIQSTHFNHTGLIPLRTSIVKNTYDDQGRILQSLYCNGWGAETSRTTYTYDDENRTSTWVDSSGTSYTTELDKQGRTIRTTNSSGTESYWEYSADGRYECCTSYHEGELQSRTEEFFDEQGRRIRFSQYDEHNTLTNQTDYIYDDEQHTMTIRDQDGSWRVEYFGQEGQRLRAEDYNPDGTLSLAQDFTYRDIQVPAKEE